MLNIEICMGSSCYSRGNSKSIQLIEDYIASGNLEDQISLTGKLCLGNCAEGPNIIVNSVKHKNCTPDCVIDLLTHYLQEE